jgi:hypothetical protein
MACASLGPCYGLLVQILLIFESEKKMAASMAMFNKSFKGYKSPCTSTFQVLANKKSSTPVINAIACSQWLPRLTLESGVPVFLFTGEFSPNFNLEKKVSTYTRIFHGKKKTPKFARFSRFLFYFNLFQTVRFVL